MRLVAKQTDVPVPEVLFTRFSPDEGIITPEEFFKPDYRPSEGTIGMTIISGITLEQKWDSLEDEARESICLQLWDLISNSER
ncbi:kinase-like protein [Penicillium vulpinum]|uniref:kinase-like protein n=1 Tax=Penicillium vulpinum TaxID=29845 RepID=UPI0025486932|nr:kinase-like protein [Penicillium vulpinum]KAJ5963604.1 kinase-like protein [Penicillium vulpinum]